MSNDLIDAWNLRLNRTPDSSLIDKLEALRPTALLGAWMLDKCIAIVSKHQAEQPVCANNAPTLRSEISVVEKALENGARILADFKPEGERDKLDEWQGCYALLFKQLNDAVQEIRRLQQPTAPVGDLPLVFKDDGKGKHQSIEAYFTCDSSLLNLSVIGFGANEAEARKDLMSNFQPALDAIRPYLRTTEPVSIDAISKRTNVPYADVYHVLEAVEVPCVD